MFFINQPKKKLGQNFLIDQNIIKKIVKIGCINKNKTVLEIGSGYGSLTKEILNNKPPLLLSSISEGPVGQLLEIMNLLRALQYLNIAFKRTEKGQI